MRFMCNRKVNLGIPMAPWGYSQIFTSFKML